MIFYSPELNEIISIELREFFYSQLNGSKTKFGVTYNPIYSEKTFSSVAWYYIGEL